MNNIAGSMKSLCEDIIKERGDRKGTVKQLKVRAQAIRDNARKFLSNSKRFHEKMSKDLKKGLRERREGLIKNVNVLREDFRKKEREVKADLAEASKIWSKINDKLRNKKTKPK
jgi:hypothetical protein